MRGRAGQDIDGIQRPGKPCVRLGQRERTFSDVTICELKLSNFETFHRGNATEAFAWVDYIPASLCRDRIFTTKVCAEYIIARRGLACVAYPYIGAMLRPDSRDRHGEIDSHVFFISTFIIILMLNLGVHRQLK